jgi:hypothetical protein
LGIGRHAASERPFKATAVDRQPRAVGTADVRTAAGQTATIVCDDATAGHGEPPQRSLRGNRAAADATTVRLVAATYDTDSA